jgi:hypothetical protein
LGLSPAAAAPAAGTGKGAALPYDRKKLVLVLSAIRHFRDELRARGFEVDHRVAPSYAEGIRDHWAAFRPATIHYQQPAEWGIGRSIERLAETLPAMAALPDRRFPDVASRLRRLGGGPHPVPDGGLLSLAAAAAGRHGRRAGAPRVAPGTSIAATGRPPPPSGRRRFRRGPSVSRPMQVTRRSCD